MHPEVVVVVVTYNSADVVAELLDTIPAAMGDTTYEVVIVDNASSDHTVALLRDRGDVKVVERPNDGYSAGINRGAEQVPDAETILVLNPDVRLMPGAVPAMLRRMRSTGAGVVAPRMVTGDGRLALSLRREPTLLRASGFSFTGRRLLSEYVQDDFDYANAHVISWAVGAVLLVDHRCHRQLGGWDESYFLYSEETDFCLRAADRGWVSFYEPQAVALHIGGASGRSGQTHAMQILNRVRMYARRHSAPAAWTYYGLTVVSEMSWYLRGIQESRSSLRALVRPKERPDRLGLGSRLLPR